MYLYFSCHLTLFLFTSTTRTKQTTAAHFAFDDVLKVTVGFDFSFLCPVLTVFFFVLFFERTRVLWNFALIITSKVKQRETGKQKNKINNNIGKKQKKSAEFETRRSVWHSKALA